MIIIIIIVVWRNFNVEPTELSPQCVPTYNYGSKLLMFGALYRVVRCKALSSPIALANLFFQNSQFAEELSKVF